jgi:hypothetical protein
MFDPIIIGTIMQPDKIVVRLIDTTRMDFTNKRRTMFSPLVLNVGAKPASEEFHQAAMIQFAPAVLT